MDLELETIITLRDGTHIKYDYLLNKLATELFVNTTYYTQSNNWTVDFEELEEAYLLAPRFIDKKVANDIEDRLMALYGEMVAEVIIGDDCFDVTLYDTFVLGYPQTDLCIEENNND